MGGIEGELEQDTPQIQNGNSIQSSKQPIEESVSENVGIVDRVLSNKKKVIDPWGDKEITIKFNTKTDIDPAIGDPFEITVSSDKDLVSLLKALSIQEKIFFLDLLYELLQEQKTGLGVLHSKNRILSSYFIGKKLKKTGVMSIISKIYGKEPISDNLSTVFLENNIELIKEILFSYGFTINLYGGEGAYGAIGKKQRSLEIDRKWTQKVSTELPAKLIEESGTQEFINLMRQNSDLSNFMDNLSLQNRVDFMDHLYGLLLEIGTCQYDDKINSLIEYFSSGKSTKSGIAQTIKKIYKKRTFRKNFFVRYVQRTKELLLKQEENIVI